MMLEQEIEKYLSGQTLCNCDSVSYRNIKNLILGFAEPREKQIAELKETCNKWFEHLKNREEELLNELNNQNAKYNKQIEDLEKENAELKTSCKIQVETAFQTIYEKDEQLTKAKEIIKELLDFDFLPDIEIKKQAEQFLKDQEEEPCGQ